MNGQCWAPGMVSTGVIILIVMCDSQLVSGLVFLRLCPLPLQVVWKFPAQSKQLAYSFKVKSALLHFKGKCDLCWKMFRIHQDEEGRRKEGKEEMN